MENQIKISRRYKARPKDVYITIMLRKKNSKELDHLALISGRSRNELINLFLDYCFKNVNIVD